MNKNRDYTRYSKGRVETTEAVEAVKIEEAMQSAEPVVEDEPVVTEQESKIEEPEVEEAEPVIGVVTNCTRLNVREDPHSSSTVLGVITAATELIIIEEESTEEFYKICTSAGLEGYCMKQYITIMP